MSLKEYATKHGNTNTSQAGDWKERADAALHHFQSVFQRYMENHIDLANRLQKGKRRILTTKYESNNIAAVPLIEILYERKSMCYSSELPCFRGIDRSGERHAMVIRVNNQEEADYCAERIKKMLLSEGIKIDECRRIRSGLVIKYKDEGYVIGYTFEW